MDSQALVCNECGTLHCVPSAPTTPIGNFASSSGPTAEQEPKPNSTFPSQILHQCSPGIMEDVRTELPLEQPVDVPTVNPMHLMRGQQQQEEDLLVQSLELSGLPDQIDGKRVHKAQNPCRRCFQQGTKCRRKPGSDSCERCEKYQNSCNSCLTDAKPRSGSRWSKCIVVDYSSPCTISASRIIHDFFEGDKLEYYAGFVPKGRRAAWRAAEELKAYPGILKKFHYDNPQMPGPPDWLVVEEGDAFFYGHSNQLPKV